MIKLTHCPSCNSQEKETVIVCKDNTVSKKYFEINKCNKCQLLFTNPRPKTENLGEYYMSDEYISHTNSSKGVFNSMYQLIRKITIKNKVSLLGNKKGNLLEIGSGTGNLLNECKKNGWKTRGVEPSVDARKIARENYGLNLFAEIDELKLKPKSQDRVMLWHVLEHISELKQTLEKVKGLMKNDGKLIIAVPNHLSFDAKHYKENWAAYDVPRHLYHFQEESMKELLKKWNLEITEKKPMLFDAFYVSMLSEKIKHGRIKFVKGFVIGLYSNLVALLKNKQYSSIIYIIESNEAK